MNGPIRLSELMIARDADPKARLVLFSLINLGLVESLAGGILSATDAVRVFYRGENCLFVHDQIKNKVADEIMSRGVQLPDLFDVLTSQEAIREFQRELAEMRPFA